MVTLAAATPTVATSAPSAIRAERKTLAPMASSQEAWRLLRVDKIAHVAVSWPPVRPATILLSCPLARGSADGRIPAPVWSTPRRLAEPQARIRARRRAGVSRRLLCLEPAAPRTRAARASAAHRGPGVDRR